MKKGEIIWSNEHVKSGGWISLFLLIGFALLVYVIDWGFLKNEITDYTIDCPPDFGACYTLRYTRYKVNPTRQEVLYWVEGFPPERLTGCAVRDRKNWQCEYNDKSATFGYESGQYFEFSNGQKSSTDELVKYQKSVSRFEYLKLSWFPQK